MDKLVKRNYEINGKSYLENLVIEECAELIDAMAKYKRGRLSINTVIEEMADVQMTINNILEINDKKTFFDNCIEYKKQRLKEVLKITDVNKEEKQEHYVVEKYTIYNRFKVSEDYIEDTKTNYIWERDISKRGEMNWSKALEINDNGFKLPSIEDFKTLNIKNREFGYPMKEDLEEIGFINVHYEYWSANNYSSGDAWGSVSGVVTITTATRLPLTM